MFVSWSQKQPMWFLHIAEVLSVPSCFIISRRLTGVLSESLKFSAMTLRTLYLPNAAAKSCFPVGFVFGVLHWFGTNPVKREVSKMYILTNAYVYNTIAIAMRILQINAFTRKKINFNSS